MRVQDEADYACAARKQPAMFTFRLSLRMGLKRKQYTVLNSNYFWHEDQSISQPLQRENGRENRSNMCGCRDERQPARLHQVFQRDHRDA